MLLPIAEFAYNNTAHSSTKTTPFFANLGYHPKFSVRVPRVTRDNVPVADRVQALKDLHTEMRFNIQSALEEHAKYFDAKVSKQPDFQVGDRVWLDARNLRTERSARKLDYKKVGPYTISEKVNSRSYRLDLPRSMKVHPVFHVSLLERFQPDAIPGRAPKPQPPLVIAGEEEYEVETILDSRMRRGRLQYHIHWKGYPVSERSWEPVEFVQHCPDLIRSFHEAHPGKPGPLLRGAQP